VLTFSRTELVRGLGANNGSVFADAGLEESMTGKAAEVAKIPLKNDLLAIISSSS